MEKTDSCSINSNHDMGLVQVWISALEGCIPSLRASLWVFRTNGCHVLCDQCGPLARAVVNRVPVVGRLTSAEAVTMLPE